MKFGFPSLSKEQVGFLLVGGAASFVVFVFFRRAGLISSAKAAKDQTKAFIYTGAVNSPPPGANFNMSQIIPLYSGTAGYTPFLTDEVGTLIADENGNPISLEL